MLDAVLAAVAGFIGSDIGTGCALHRRLARRRRPLSREALRLMQRYPSAYSFDPISTVHDQRQGVDVVHGNVHRTEGTSVSR